MPRQAAPAARQRRGHGPETEIGGPGAGNQRPRETRSISAFTMRSTRPGRLSSRQDFSIGRSISLTRSSSVRALLLKTVCARLLKADSTADTVVRDIMGAESIGLGGGISNADSRGGIFAAASVNSR